MAMSTDPVFPQTPKTFIATLTSPTAITSRANITGTTGLVSLTDATTNGFQLDAITVKAKETTVAGTVFIWLYDGTTSFLFKEIDVTAVTASTTVKSFESTTGFVDTQLIPTQRLYISSTIDQDFSVFAHGGAW
jgi:hypothetical protein